MSWVVTDIYGVQIGSSFKLKSEADKFATLCEGQELATILVTETPDD